MSRCHYLDINITTDEEKFLWLKYVSLSSSMLTDKGLAFDTILLLLDYINKNIVNMSDLSLRSVIKLADLYLIDSDNWLKTADITLLRT